MPVSILQSPDRRLFIWVGLVVERADITLDVTVWPLRYTRFTLVLPNISRGYIVHAYHAVVGSTISRTTYIDEC